MLDDKETGSMVIPSLEHSTIGPSEAVYFMAVHLKNVLPYSAECMEIATYLGNNAGTRIEFNGVASVYRCRVSNAEARVFL